MISDTVALHADVDCVSPEDFVADRQSEVTPCIARKNADPLRL